MCGFAGFLDPSRDASAGTPEEVVGRMADTLLHRGPDGSGVWADHETGLAFGHRRLAIVELSELGHQPMVSRCGRYVVSFNGEIYNFQALRDELRGRGATFRGGSDTEVLLAAVAEWGVPEALRRLVGMFAFGIWDREERALYLCRDRLGEKPLYYGWSGGAFLFGSELKALRAFPRWEGEYDRGAASLFLRYAYVPTPFSIYRGIRKLVPGTYLRLTASDRGTLPEPIEYWSARQAVEAGRASPYGGSLEEATAELERLLRDAVRMQMIADVPLGAFLSGGIDSSTTVAAMQAESDRPVKTFSIGFHEQRFNEAEYAKEVARHLGTDHSELYVTPAEAIAVIPRLPELYDEPFADSSQIPTFLVSQLARRSVTVSLSGDGGDELFGGYIRYISGPRIWNRMRRIPRSVRTVAGRALASVPAGVWEVAGRGGGTLLPAILRQRRLSEKVQKFARVLEAGDPEAIYRTLVSSWDPAYSPLVDDHAPETLVTRSGDWPAADDFAARMMYLDLVTYLPDDILTKVDRAAMGVSLETRIPLLDHRIVEFAFSLPMHYKIRGGVGKWVLRRVLDRYVPRELVERPKAGFAVPVGEWIRGPLRDWAEALLSEGRLRDAGLLRPAPIRQFWKEHLAGNRDRSLQLWPVLMLQAWEAHASEEGDQPRERAVALSRPVATS